MVASGHKVSNPYIGTSPGFLLSFGEEIPKFSGDMSILIE
jgi:hypothetical protein